MPLHPNAKLGPAGRCAVVRAIESGASFRTAAARFGVAPATAHRWWHRWLAADASARASAAWCADRTSRPRTSPRMLSSTAQAAICTARRRTGWGPRLIAGELGRPHSTVWKTLRRHGLSRLVRPPRPAARRYEWPCPGDLLHMDTKRYARFERPGHAMTGVRTRTGAERRARWGYEYAHTIVDDHTRLAYSELHADERAVTVTGFVERALDWFTAHGISCQRVMTDNAWAYVHNKALKELLEQRGVRHLTIQPRRPQTNGKVERFHQTMSREWAYGQTYASHHGRDAALPHWLAHYNTSRPHSALGSRPPISRVHNLSRQDN
jgi:transposase InsO family protein